MHNATRAYASVSRTALSPREAEAAVLMKAAQLLQTVKDDWRGGGAALSEAVGFNRKVWTILSSAAAEASPLPAEVRGNIVGLGIFVFNQSISALAEPAADKLSSLIAINRELAAGLRGNP